MVPGWHPPGASDARMLPGLTRVLLAVAGGGPAAPAVVDPEDLDMRMIQWVDKKGKIYRKP